MTDYFDDDENVKAMRETAHEIGLSQLLLDLSRSDDFKHDARLVKALELLGVSDDEVSR